LIALKAIRTEKGVTISELARRSGVCRQTIYKLEGQDCSTNTRILKALADALGVPVSAFFVD